MLKIGICHDDQSQIEYLTNLVSLWTGKSDNYIQIKPFSSAESFLFYYEDDKSFDILLPDIKMGNINGVELAKQIRKDNESVQIIFITGFAEYISEGYDVSALHYLMKPVSDEKLFEVLDKALSKLFFLQISNNLFQLFNLLNR